MLHPSVLLLLALQISAVFCRTTADYEDETTAIENTAVSETFEGSTLHHEMHNESAVEQGTVLYRGDYYNRRARDYQFTVILAVSISMGLFVLGSLILGFVLCICCRSKPKRGHIVRNATMNQTSEVQQRPASVAMQPFPSDQGSVQQYPSTAPPMKQPPTNPYHLSQQPNPNLAVQPSQQ